MFIFVYQVKYVLKKRRIKMKKNYEALVSYFADDDFILDMISGSMKSFPEYVNRVYSMETQMAIISVRYDGEERANRIASLDQKRRDAHEIAIGSCGMLNRLAEEAGVEKFCPETDDRYVIGDFCALITCEFFASGKNYSSFDELIANMKESVKGGINA